MEAPGTEADAELRRQQTVFPNMHHKTETLPSTHLVEVSNDGKLFVKCYVNAVKYSVEFHEFHRFIMTNNLYTSHRSWKLTVAP